MRQESVAAGQVDGAVQRLAAQVGAVCAPRALGERAGAAVPVVGRALDHARGRRRPSRQVSLCSNSKRRERERCAGGQPPREPERYRAPVAVRRLPGGRLRRPGAPAARVRQLGHRASLPARAHGAHTGLAVQLAAQPLARPRLVVIVVFRESAARLGVDVRAALAADER